MLEPTHSIGHVTVETLGISTIRYRFHPENSSFRERAWSVASAPPQEGGAGEVFELTFEGDRFHYRGRAFARLLAAPELAVVDAQGCKGLGFQSGDSLPEPASTRVSLRLEKGAGGYFGFGQKTVGLERSGHEFVYWNTDAAHGHTRNTDPLYQSHPVFLVIEEDFCWGMFLNSTFWSRIDAGKTDPTQLVLETLGGQLELIVMAGETPAAVVDRLTALTGRPLKVPVWALGYHQSRWGYKSSEELATLAAEFKTRDIPLEVLHFDIDYMEGFRSFTFSKERFPDPAELIGKLGCRVVTIVDPGIKHEFDSGYEVSREGAQSGYFLTDKGGAPYVGYCWPDAAMFPDFSRPEVRRWWGDLYSFYLDRGVAGIWIDMNEPAIFDRPFSEGLAGHQPLPLATTQAEGSTHAEMHNLYGLQMSQATFEGLRRLRPDLRPWVLTRSTFVGGQQYAASWMGDNTSWWEHLEQSVAQLASMGLVGSPHVGVDIGGFFGDCDPELYARWIELGVFYPFMRTHTALGTRAQEPWSFGPEVEEIARETIRFRYRLLPYLHHLSLLCHETGAPLMRPLCYQYPHDRRSWHVDDQFLLGEGLMVCPITRRGHRERLVYFPPGDWLDFFSGRRYRGRAVIDAPLGRAPLFLKAGSVICLGNQRRNSDEPLTELTWIVAPGRDYNLDLRQDDGLTWEAEEWSWPVRLRGNRVEFGARRGDGPATPVAFRFQWLGPPEETSGATFSFDGRPVEADFSWLDDGSPHELVVTYS